MITETNGFFFMRILSNAFQSEYFFGSIETRFDVISALKNA
jgi:hypothetical protein